MILVIRSNSPDVYIGLWSEGEEIVQKSWQAGRELSGQILDVITALCEQANSSLEKLSGIVVYEGPGSYTGLRISMSVANALGSSLSIPVAATSGDSWQQLGLKNLQNLSDFHPVSPVYGGKVYTTKPRK